MSVLKIVEANNVGTTMSSHNYPPVITIDSWDVGHSQSWVVYGIVIPTLSPYQRITKAPLPYGSQAVLAIETRGSSRYE